MLAMEPMAPRTVKNVEVICIASRSEFPARAAYTPPFRARGMAGNRLLPHTVYKGGKNSTWTVGFHVIHYTFRWGKVKQNIRIHKEGAPQRVFAVRPFQFQFVPQGHHNRPHGRFRPIFDRISPVARQISPGHRPDFTGTADPSSSPPAPPCALPGFPRSGTPPGWPGRGGGSAGR